MYALHPIMEQSIVRSAAIDTCFAIAISLEMGSGQSIPCIFYHIRESLAEVHIAQVGSEQVRLNLAERGALCNTGLVGDGILIALAAVTIASDDDDTVNFRVRHGQLGGGPV